MLKRNLHYILLILLLINAGFALYQCYYMPLDGDMAKVILPDKAHSYVLEDPLALGVLLHNKVYDDPNRFFAHWFMSKYFKSVPFLFQHFVNPIDSIYLASAFIKVIIQLFIVYLLASAGSLSKNIFDKNFLITAILIAPLLQINGYDRTMGILDHSITYTMFYALPISLLILYFLPFYRSWMCNRSFEFNRPTVIFLLVSPVVLTLSGPLIPGVVIIICAMVLINLFGSSFKKSRGKLALRIYQSVKLIPKQLLFYFTLISLFSVYSFYIGLNNAENTAAIPLLKRYLLLPHGLLLLVQSLGIQLLLVAVIANAVIIRKWYYTNDGKKILRLFTWVGVFSIIYIIALPFGGYRDYRPYIARYDTIMPITIGLMLIYGLSTYFLINSIATGRRFFYIGAVVLFLLIYKIADTTVDNNTCEKQALAQIASSPDKIVALQCDCTVMQWYKVTDDTITNSNAQLLQYWGITKDKKLYYQK